MEIKDSLNQIKKQIEKQKSDVSVTAVTVGERQDSYLTKGILDLSTVQKDDEICWDDEGMIQYLVPSYFQSIF